jgi:uncharacterized protein YegL
MKKTKKQEAKSDVTEIVCIVDRSGSMSSIKGDAIGGFNSFLQTQKKLPGEARLTLVLFDDQYEMIHDSVPIKDVDELDSNTFVPRGMTSLFDAIGRTISHIKSKISGESKKPGVIFSILTDGQENSSKEFRNKSQISELITEHREKDKWEFIYLAANQDAIGEGQSLGISGNLSLNFVAQAGKATRSMNAMNYATSSFRTKGASTLYSVNLDSMSDEDLKVDDSTFNNTTVTSTTTK